MLGKETPFSFHATITRVHCPRVGQYNAAYTSSRRWVHLPSPPPPRLFRSAASSGCPPHSAPRQRARVLPFDALRSPLRRGWVTRSRRGTGNPPARPGSKRREKPATVLCPLPTAGVLVPSTAAPATNACAASTTTASGSTTAWARGTTGERQARATGVPGDACVCASQGP